MRRILLPGMAARVAATALATAALTAPAHAQPAVSFAGDLTGTIVSQGPGRCGPGRITVDVTLAGMLSPFGAATGTQSACFNPGSFHFFDGFFTLAFASGGTLFGTQFGTLVPTGPQLFSSTSTFTITGGTGVFAGATGGGSSSGMQNAAAGVVTARPTGTVRAPGLVPEPSTFALLAGGLAGAAAIGRSRRRSRGER